MSEQRSGTVTLLFTDVEGSTQLLHQLGDASAADVLDAHRKILRRAVAKHRGEERDTQGDSFLFAFDSARDAVWAAIEGQRALNSYQWPDSVAVRVRMAMHTADPIRRKGAFFGLGVHRAARICATGWGGQVLLSQTTADIVANDLPPGVALRDLGEHRLKDLPRPERIFQLLATDLPANLSPLRSLSTSPTNLPAQLSSFVGRQLEAVQIKDLLSGSRLVTLIGPGGMGKTRLALHVAEDLLESYRHGVWFVDLAPVVDPTLVSQSVAAVMEVREQPGRELVESVVDHLQNKRLLVVLDNCEHLKQACARLADTLLRRCPELGILATSRESLAITGETVFPVPPLPLPDSQAQPGPEGLREYEAVRLFVERAKAVRPDFRLSDRTGPPIAQVCRRLDGMPLAIELAAARVTVLSIDEIARRLDDRFRLLIGRSRAAVPRHQTLRAAMEWSYAQLTLVEQMLFNRLSVFAGSFSLKAVEEICSGVEVAPGEVLDLLASLIDKSLVEAEETSKGGVRYRLLETMREYGAMRLIAMGEEEVVKRRHRDFFLHLAEEGETHKHAPDLGEWLRRLEDDHDNLRGALAWSLENDQEGEVGLRLAAALRYFWGLRGYWTEARLSYEATLAHDYARPSVGRARVLNALAGMLADLEGWSGGSRVVSLFEESLRVFRVLGDKEGIGTVITNFGSLAMAAGEFTKARGLFEEALALQREIGDQHAVAFLIFKLGNLARRQRDFSRALTLYEESVALNKKLGDKWGTALVLNATGLTLRIQGDLIRARQLLGESLALSEEIDEVDLRPMVHLNLGYVAQSDQRYDDAARHFATALEECRQVGDRLGMAAAGAALGGVAALKGEFESAVTFFASSEGIRRQVGADPLSSSEDRENNARNLAMARAALGEERFSQVWEAGLRMPLERAVTYSAAPSVSSE